MAIFLCSALLVAALSQGTVAPSSNDSIPTDGRSWAALGRAYLGRYRAERPGPAVLDSAEHALLRAVAVFGSADASAEADSARVLRVQVWSERALLGWTSGAVPVGATAWGPVPADLRLSPVLEELGENLLRACPKGGVLLTAGTADTYAAWYMRFVRGLRPDLLVVPYAVWRSDTAFRARAAHDLRLGKRGAGDGWLAALADRRPACASMAFPGPPTGRLAVRWTSRPLVWVAEPHSGEDRVPPRDFDFAALKLALDTRDPWAQEALALYDRAARSNRSLCDALATFKVSGAIASCRR